MRVVEVDRERGRIGLRLADDPEIAGKTRRGAGGGRRRRRRRRRTAAVGRRRPRRPSRNGRERGRAAPRRGRAVGAARLRPSPPRARPRRDRRRRPAAVATPTHRPSTTLGLGRAGGHRARARRCARWRSASGSATGSAHERDEQAGISHLLEHMLFRGTERYGSEEIDQIFDAMGAELNAGTDKEAPRCTRACSTATSSAPST